MRVLDLGCSTGDLLASLLPEGGVGVDISRRSVEIARSHHPKHTFIVADAESLPTTPPFDSPFDMIIMSDIVAYLDDVQTVLSALRRLTHPDTYIVISLWNWIWRPLLQVGEVLHLKAPDLRARQNWLSTKALTNLLDLTDYAVVEATRGLLIRFGVPIPSPAVNALTSTPLLDPLALLHT